MTDVAVTRYLVRWPAAIEDVRGPQDRVVRLIQEAVDSLPTQRAIVGGRYWCDQGYLVFDIIVETQTETAGRAFAIRGLRAVLDAAGIGLAPAPTEWAPLRLNLDPSASHVQRLYVDTESFEQR